MPEGCRALPAPLAAIAQGCPRTSPEPAGAGDDAGWFRAVTTADATVGEHAFSTDHEH